MQSRTLLYVSNKWWRPFPLVNDWFKTTLDKKTTTEEAEWNLNVRVFLLFWQFVLCTLHINWAGKRDSLYISNTHFHSAHNQQPHWQYTLQWVMACSGSTSILSSLVFFSVHPGPWKRQATVEPINMRMINVATWTLYSKSFLKVDAQDVV